MKKYIKDNWFNPAISPKDLEKYIESDYYIIVDKGKEFLAKYNETEDAFYLLYGIDENILMMYYQIKREEVDAWQPLPKWNQ